MEESRMDGQRPTLTRGTEIYAHSTRIKQIPFILFINAHNSEPPKRVVPARRGRLCCPAVFSDSIDCPHTKWTTTRRKQRQSTWQFSPSTRQISIGSRAGPRGPALSLLKIPLSKKKKKNSQPMLVTWKKKWFKHQGLTLYRTLYKRLQKETLDEGRLEGGRKTVCVPTICCPVASAAFHFWWSHHARLPGDAFGGPNS